MKRVDMIRTSDGFLHTNLQDAQAHAKKRIAEKLDKLGHEFVKAEGKFQLLKAAIMTNLHALGELQALQNDVTLEEDDDA